MDRTEPQQHSAALRDVCAPCCWKSIDAQQRGARVPYAHPSPAACCAAGRCSFEVAKCAREAGAT